MDLRKALKLYPLERPNAKSIDLHDKPEISYLFNNFPIANDEDLIISKILFVNFRESTRVKNINIEQLAKHIVTVLNNSNFESLQTGELNEEYFSIVENIAFGHGLKSNKNNRVEDNMTSFATKFCGHHNQKSPFYDNYVYQVLKYWGFEIKERNYKEYIKAFLELQKCQQLESFSLRHIESYVWKSAKNVVGQMDLLQK